MNPHRAGLLRDANHVVLHVLVRQDQVRQLINHENDVRQPLGDLCLFRLVGRLERFIQLLFGQLVVPRDIAHLCF